MKSCGYLFVFFFYLIGINNTYLERNEVNLFGREILEINFLHFERELIP